MDHQRSDVRSHNRRWDCSIKTSTLGMNEEGIDSKTDVYYMDNECRR